MASCMRLNSVSRLLQTSRCFQTCVVPASNQARAAEQMERYWKKNRDQNRPLSPHLTVYKLPMTAVMSISNRITGTILTGVMFVGPIVYLCGTKDFNGYIDMIQSWGSLGVGLVQLAKFSVAFSFSYHVLASIRHLTWDMVLGFGLPQIAKTGYFIVLCTLIMTAALMSL
ncbi:hypothetical protein ACF0H5_018608 [Mactra antiquata]